jgi:hypothetical protein
LFTSRLALGLGVAAAITLCAIASCGKDSHDDPGACSSSPKPAFYLVVRAVDLRPLPSDTTISVHFGSGSEDFALDNPSASPKSVFCGIVAPGADVDAGGVDAGPDSGPAQQIACSLWTDGAADVTVVAKGLATQEQSFEAKIGDCDHIVTTSALIELTPPDGG